MCIRDSFHLTETPSRSYLQTIHTHVYADATACYTLTDHIAESYAARLAGRPFSTAPIDVGDRSARARVEHILRGARLSVPALRARDGGLALPEGAPGPRAFSRTGLEPQQTQG